MCNHNLIEHLNWSHLHVHTEYSDGYSSVTNLVNYASQINLTGLAITDHGIVSGCVRHTDLCLNHGIKPILGSEIYFQMEGIERRFHATVLCDGSNTGYKNLIELNNIAHTNPEKTSAGIYPMVTFDMLAEYGGQGSGIIFLTGCPSSAIHYDDYEVADFYVSQLTRIIESGNLYCEVMNPLIGHDFYSRPLEFADKYALPTVFTNDCHLIKKGQDEKHRIYIQAKRRWDGDGFDSSRLYLLNKKEAWELANEVLDEEQAYSAFENVHNLVERLETPDLFHEPSLPDASDIIDEYQDYLLYKLALDCAENPSEEEVRISRLDREWSFIDKYGEVFWTYFAIIWDIMQFAKKEGIMCGTRGSGGGSYTLYLSDVTQLDPVKYKLMLFERFLNSLRLAAHELPDVDIDVQSGRRDEIQSYAEERWGMKGVLTYMTLSHKSLVRFIARGVEKEKGITIPPQTVTAAAECAATGPTEDDYSTEEVFEMEPFQKFADYFEPIRDMYAELRDCISHVGQHACALVSLNSGVDIPVGFSSHGELLVALVESGADKSLGKVGGVKLDLLGLVTLQDISDLRDVTSILAPVDFDDGDEIFNMFREKDMLDFFQFSSRMGQKIAHDAALDSIQSISDATALNRPGPLRNGFHTTYCNWDADISHYPDAIKEILKPTRGVFVYQEQIAMALGHFVTDDEVYGLELGCKWLKEIVPKSPKVRLLESWAKNYKAIKTQFITSGQELRGYDKGFCEEIFHVIEAFAGYAFNAAHSLQYAALSAREAYYAYHYIAPFIQTRLSKYAGNSQRMDSTISYMIHLVRRGSTIHPPHVNVSTKEYTVHDGSVYCPLQSIVGLGPKGVDEVLSAREEGGDFTSMKDFGERISARGVKRTTRLKMLNAGGFNGLSGTPYELGALEHKVFKRKEDYFEPMPNYSEETNHIRNALGFSLPTPRFLTIMDKCAGLQTANKVAGYIVDSEQYTTKSGSVCRRYYLHNGRRLSEILRPSKGHLSYLKSQYRKNHITIGSTLPPVEHGRFVGINLAVTDDGKKTHYVNDVTYLD